MCVWMHNAVSPHPVDCLATGCSICSPLYISWTLGPHGPSASIRAHDGLLVHAGNILRTAFNSNTAGQGGAVFGTSSSGNILNSTFTTNKADQARAACKQACFGEY